MPGKYTLFMTPLMPGIAQLYEPVPGSSQLRLGPMYSLCLGEARFNFGHGVVGPGRTCSGLVRQGVPLSLDFQQVPLNAYPFSPKRDLALIRPTR